ncbi:uncharacterized protein [Chironomus tepperi]|uniref:uncharacterized protein n=1 Tax=Chironomus tepperi TaxID=113505 RepID=UPI00391FB365
MIVTEILFFVTLFMAIKLLWQQRRFLYLASKIPKSNFDFSVKGIYKFLTADSKELFEMSYDSFNDTEGTVKTWLGHVLMVILGNPEDVKIVMKSKDCIDKPKFMKFFRAPEGVLFGDYEPWHAHRKILNPYFNVQGVKAFIPLFNEKSKKLMECIKVMEGKGEFDVFYYLTALALETVMKVMDYDTEIINTGKESREDYVKHLRDFLKSVSLRIFKPWLHPEILYQQTKTYQEEQKALNHTALRFSAEILQNMRQKVENNDLKSKSFMKELVLSNLCENEINDEIRTLMVAAQDTTALSSSSILLLLAMYKDIQSKVVAELHQVFGKTLEVPFIDHEQLNELQYLEQVMNEAMRLTPVVPIVFRLANDDVTLSDGSIVPKGSNIIIPIHRIQRNKKFWGDDAEQFRPDRFEKENLEKVHPYAFIPFTKGSRMCLGYRYAMTLMKIQLANFLLRYEVDTTLKFEELEYELNTTMNICQGYMISIKERKFSHLSLHIPSSTSEMIVLEILIFTIVFWILKHFWNSRRFYYLAYKIPTSTFDFSFRGIYNFITADSRMMLKLINESFENESDITKTWLGKELFIIPNNPDDVKIIFNSKHCYDKPNFVKFSSALPKGSLFGDLEYWRSHRKVMNPFFGYQGLRTVVPIFNEKTKILIKSLETMVDKEAFNIFHNMTALTLETIMKVMEYDVDIQNQEATIRDVFIKNLENFTKTVFMRMFKFWHHADIIFRNSSLYKLQQHSMSNCAMVFTNDIIENIRTKSNNNEVEKPKSFMQALINPKSNFTDDEIKDEVHSIVLAAQDTSAITSSMTLLMLAMYKDIQQRIVDELHQIFGKTQETPYIEFETLNELNYLEMVINEVMRLFPVVPFVVRQVDEEMVLSDIYRIPAKSTVIVPISRIQKNKKYWGVDAEEFNPERFSKENFAKIHPYAYLPFTKGPRMCLGHRYAMMLMKIQLANFLMRYEVDTDLKFDELEFGVQVTMTVCQGYMIKIRDRKY